MKKIFILLILTALFAIPRSAKAQFWKIATGNEWRINPNNPSDPNDSVKIPAGVRFVYVYGTVPSTSPYAVDDAQFTDEGGNWVGFAVNWYGMMRYSTLPLEQPCDKHCFEDQIADRVSRHFGYTFGHYPNTASNAAALRRYRNKIVITEKEALGLKKINLDYRLYPAGEYNGSIYYGESISSLSGLQIFSNLEEIILEGTAFQHASNQDYANVSASCFTTAFMEWLNEQRDRNEADPSVFVPNLPDDSLARISYVNYHPQGNLKVRKNLNYLSFMLRCFPKLKKFTMNKEWAVNTGTNIMYLDISNHPSLEYVDLGNSCPFLEIKANNTKLSYLNVGAPGNWGDDDVLEQIECINSPNLESIDNLTGHQRLQIVRIRETSIKSLDFTGCKLLNQLYCDNNALPVGGINLVHT